MHDADIADYLRREVITTLAAEWKSQNKVPGDGDIAAVVNRYGELDLAECVSLLGGCSKQTIANLTRVAADNFRRQAAIHFGGKFGSELLG
jgi:hypothetical protein